MTLGRAGVIVVLAAAVVRLVVAAAVPLHPDEAFYWEWSRHLAAGYSEHPPMVALFIRAGTALFGDTPFGVRFASVICGVVAGFAVMLTARTVAETETGDAAAIVLTAMPIMAGAFLLATPDAPLLAFIALTLLCAARGLVATASAAATAWWVGAGLAAGLAMASKYTAVLVPLAAALAVCAVPSLRRALSTPGPYIGVLMACLVMLPVLRWNAGHDWVSFRTQIAHGLHQSGGAAWRRELELLGGQVLVVSPILFVLSVGAMMRAVREDGRIARLLTVVIVVVGAFFAWSATRSRVEANWPAPAWVTAAVLLAIVRLDAKWVRWRSWGVTVGFLFSAITYLQSVAGVVPLPARRDPTANAYGWADLAEGVARERPVDRGRRWLATNRYQDAAELAFNLPDHPEVFSLNLSRRSNQYLLWPGFPERASVGDDLLLVLFDRPPDAPDPALTSLAPLFQAVEKGALVVMRRGSSAVGARRLWVLRGWKGAWLPAPSH